MPSMKEILEKGKKAYDDAKTGAEIIGKTALTIGKRAVGNNSPTKLSPEAQKNVDEKLNRPKAKKAMK